MGGRGFDCILMPKLLISFFCYCIFYVLFIMS